MNWNSNSILFPGTILYFHLFPFGSLKELSLPGRNKLISQKMFISRKYLSFIDSQEDYPYPLNRHLFTVGLLLILVPKVFSQNNEVKKKFDFLYFGQLKFDLLVFSALWNRPFTSNSVIPKNLPKKMVDCVNLIIQSLQLFFFFI